MEILKMKQLGTGKQFPLQRKCSLLESCIKDYEILKRALERHKEFLKTSSYEDSFGYLLDLEEVAGMDISAEEVINSDACGVNEVVNRRIDMFILNFKDLHKMVKGFCDDFLPLSEEDLRLLGINLKISLGQLACFLYYELSLTDYSDTDESKYPDENSELDVIDYLKIKKGWDDRDLHSFANSMFQIILECNPSMGVFEKYPDLLEPFSELVGEDLYDCIDLDLGTVLDVVEGKMSLDTFREKLRQIDKAEQQAFFDSLKSKK